nr:protein kinase [Pirellulaceae bacterium]
AYMAPEQAGGKHVDARADLFSLGVVLYQMLTGRRPFVGDTALAVLVNVTTQNPTPLQTLRPECPADLSLLVMRLLAKEPAERPATAREVAQTLAGWESSAAHVRDEPSQLQPSLAPRVESGEPASVPLPQACPQPRRIRPWIAATLLLALIGGGLLFSGTVVRLVTNRGILAVEVEDPNVEIRIVQNGLVVQDPTSQREFTLSAGKGEIEVLEKDGIKLATRQFELTRGGTTRVKVTWEEPAQVRQTPKEPAASPGSDPDRRAAEWVLSIGGTVQVGQDGLAQGIANAAGPPPGEFALTHIGLSHNDRVTDAGLAACEGCRNVISLDLSYTGVTAAGLAHFRDCRDLEYLGLHHATQVTDEAMGYFAHCSRLQHLVVPGTQVTDAGLANFKECRDLVQLDLGGTRVTDARLADFQDCEDLEILWLTDCPGITDAGLAPLAKCPKLKLLALNNNPGITDAGLAHFAGSADLANLNLSYTRVTDAGLAHFKDRENLTDLFLSGTQITDAGLAHFQRCKKLWNLQLADTRVTDDGLGCLRGCTQLSNLTLTDTQVGDRGLAAFAGWKDLYALDLHNTRATEAGLAAFADCKHVRLLGLGFTPMTDAILPWLASLEDPGAISLINTRISLAGYEQLKAALPRCEITWWDANRVVAEEVLKLGGRVEIGLRDQESPRAIQAVGELPREAFHVRYVALAGAAQPPFHSLAWLQYPGLDRLEQLDLAECPVHDLGFLGPIQGLSDLSLAGTGMNDETLARLPPIPTLKRLVLDGNEIRGPGLAALAERPALAELSLGCPTLTDLGAAPLAKLTQLRRLSLAGSGLGDDGLKHLAGLTNLESLDLRKTQVTAAGVDTLQKALPKCQITFPKS